VNLPGVLGVSLVPRRHGAAGSGTGVARAAAAAGGLATERAYSDRSDSSARERGTLAVQESGTTLEQMINYPSDQVIIYAIKTFASEIDNETDMVRTRTV
jgi:hypothetical protein